MQGVTTAIVVFIFFCVAYPERVKNKPQFYAALASVVLIILLGSLAYMFSAEGLHRFVGWMTGLLQVAGILLLILSCGGLTVRQFAGEVGRAFEVIRRGGEQKEVIIPLTGEQPKARRGSDA